MALMLTFPNCKINLGLYVTNRREDGYHDIETVFYPVRLREALEVVPAKGEASIHISGKTVEGSERDNLVWKAYELLKRRLPEKIGAVDIYLHKTIPMGAGLGGGSADGAFMLKLLNDYYKLELAGEDLEGMALELGSDCPFFIRNKPQFATGRGEQMEPSTVDLSGYSIQIVSPAVHVSTAKAFQMIKPRNAGFDLRGLSMLPVEEWKGQISNDFEEPVFSLHGELREIKDQLYEQGAVYASMSGSGSAIYGVFRKGEKAVIESELTFEEHVL